VFRNFNVWGARLIDIREYGDVGCATSTGFSNLGTYLPLHIARFQAEDAYRRIDAFSDSEVPNRAGLLATAAAYAGYSYALLGEGFCTMAIDGGSALEPREVLEIAEERFTTAIERAQAASRPDIVNMALVGRARVRLDLGKPLEAAADAKQVPTDFVKNVNHSTANPRRENRVYANNHANQFISVAPEFRNLEVAGVPDPRVPVTDAGRNGNDQSTRLWLQHKYTSLSTPTPLATWAEAQLIIAEAEGGQVAVDAINRLRSKWNLPHYSSTDPEQIEQQLIEERRRELFAEGHRINDMLRLDLPWATGSNHKGEPYGEVTCLPLMNAELLNNLNLR
jgi:hypothetical protein